MIALGVLDGGAFAPLQVRRLLNSHRRPSSARRLSMSRLRPIERLLVDPSVPAELQREAMPEYAELLTERFRRQQAEERLRKVVGER